MAELLFQVFSLLVLGLIPAILLIGILAAIPAGWLMGCVLLRRTYKPAPAVVVIESNNTTL